MNKLRYLQNPQVPQSIRVLSPQIEKQKKKKIAFQIWKRDVKCKPIRGTEREITSS